MKTTNHNTYWFVGLAVAGYVYWEKNNYYVHFSDDGVEFEKGYTTSNEEEAAGLLGRYAEAQKTFHEHKGFYAKNPMELIIMKDGQLMIIDEDLLLMDEISDPNVPFSNYYYVPVEKHGNGYVDRNKGFVLCAVPSTYGYGAVNTLCIGPTGIVLAKDTGGKAVENASEIDGTWQQF